MTKFLLSPMHFIFHPVQSMATVLRSWSTGVSSDKLAEYDRDFLEMIKMGNVKFYGSAEEGIADIMAHDVHGRRHTKVQKTNRQALCA